MPADKALEIIHGHHASITFVDAQIGKVLDQLRHLELESTNSRGATVAAIRPSRPARHHAEGVRRMNAAARAP